MKKYKIHYPPQMMKNKINSSFFNDKLKFNESPIGIILGTGLPESILDLNIDCEIPFSFIFNDNTEESKNHKLIIGKTKSGKPIIIVNKRFYYYEGYENNQISYLIELLFYFGVKKLILTGPVGGINENYKKGDFVVLDDFINLMGKNPIIDNEIKITSENKFPDMSNPYDKNLKNLLIEIINENKINENIHFSCVYAGMLGPSLETRAEYRMLKNIGSDVVGMSTIPETIIANWLGIKVISINIISDECDPNNLKVVEYKDIIEIINKSIPAYKLLLSNLVEKN